MPPVLVSCTTHVSPCRRTQVHALPGSLVGVVPANSRCWPAVLLLHARLAAQLPILTAGAPRLAISHLAISSLDHMFGPVCRRKWDTGLDLTGKGDGPVLDIVRFHCDECEKQFGWGETPLCIPCATKLMLETGLCPSQHPLRTARIRPGVCYRAAGRL